MNSSKLILGAVIFSVSAACGIAVTDAQIPVNPSQPDGQKRLATFLEKVGATEGRRQSDNGGIFFDFTQSEKKRIALQSEIASKQKKEEDELRARVNKAIEAEKSAPVETIGDETATIKAKYDRYGLLKKPGVEYDEGGYPLTKKN